MTDDGPVIGTERMWVAIIKGVATVGMVLGWWVSSRVGGGRMTVYITELGVLLGFCMVLIKVFEFLEGREA